MPKEDKTYGDVKDFARDVWGDRAQDIPVRGFGLNRPPTQKEIQYMQQRFAYLQITRLSEGAKYYKDINFIKAISGWTIIDYGDAMSTSAGEIFGGELYTKDEAGNYIRNQTGHGTIVKQSVDTAAEMAARAHEKNWEGVLIIGGQRLMQWALWATAQDYKLPVAGFEPTKEECDKFERIKSIYTRAAPTFKL